MIVNPSYFRKVGREMLKGDWQTPLWVSFLAGIFLTAVSAIFQIISLKFLDGTSDLLTSFVSSTSSGNLAEIARFGTELKIKLIANIQAIPIGLWIAFLVSILLLLVLTPALKLGEHHYYLYRHAHREISLPTALLWGFPYFGKAWGLYALIVLKVLLWSLILIPAMALLSLLGGLSLLGSLLIYASLIPAILAVMRYLFAPYILAENPEMSVRECLKKSKAMTTGRKTAIFAVGLSFLIYQLLLSLVLSLLSGTGLPEAAVMVVSLFVSLVLNVYAISTFTALYLVMAHPEIEQSMNQFLKSIMQSKGMDEDMINRMLNQQKKDFSPKDDDEPSDEKEGGNNDDEKLD